MIEWLTFWTKPVPMAKRLPVYPTTTGQTAITSCCNQPRGHVTTKTQQIIKNTNPTASALPRRTLFAFETILYLRHVHAWLPIDQKWQFLDTLLFIQQVPKLSSIQWDKLQPFHLLLFYAFQTLWVFCFYSWGGSYNNSFSMEGLKNCNFWDYFDFLRFFLLFSWISLPVDFLIFRTQLDCRVSSSKFAKWDCCVT